MSELEAFRAEIRAWLEENLSGEFTGARGLGGPGREHEAFDLRLAWERHLARHGWTCLGWPVEHGGRGASVAEQVVFHEEYALADAPARVGHIGEQLLGPTLIEFGTDEQRERFLPPIARAEELWCQGYSEPGAGSDLAAVTTRAALRDGEWVIDGQKVWTSLAMESQWCFVLARTTPGSTRHHGLSYLLVPLGRPGVEIRPIVQMTGTSEFNEVFFDGARTAAANIVGAPGEGWKIAMATLGYERGVAVLGRQVGFERELNAVIELARRTGAIGDPLIRDRLTRSWVGLRIMRANAQRGVPPPMVKLVWANWHRELGELAMDVLGPAGLAAGTGGGPLGEGGGNNAAYELDRWRRLFLFSRADTIYAGSNEIQRNILAERFLGLPREHKPLGPRP